MAAADASSALYRNRLRWVMLAYLLGFFLFVALISVLEQLGVSNRIIGFAFFVLPLVGYVVVGAFSRPSHLSDFYVAGRRVPPLYNGMANAANWVSAASFIGMAGTLFILGYDGLVFILGWTAGFVIQAILIAPFLRRSGAISVAEFLADRFESQTIRLLAIVVTFSCLFAYLVAQLFACAVITTRALDLPFGTGLLIGFVVIAACSAIGGMRSVTWTQVAQFVVMLIAFLLPLIIMSSKKYGLPLPYLTYGLALQDIAALEQRLIQQGWASAAAMKAYLTPFQTYSPVDFIVLAASFMLGSAAMPHTLTRYVTTPTVNESRSSVVWTLFFVLLIYLAVPAYSAFAKLEVYAGFIGKPVADLPAWVFHYGQSGLVRICGEAPISVQAVVAACGKIAGHPGVIRLQDLFMHTDLITTVMPEIAGLPFVFAGLFAAGALAASISTATGLLITLSTALSHDVHYRLVDPTAKPNVRLAVARLLIVGLAGLAALIAYQRPPDILAMVSWAFSLAASGLFAALVLGIWWKRTNAAGAFAGMLVGFGVCLLYLVVTRYFPVLGVRSLGMSVLVNPATGRPYADLARVLADANLVASAYPAAINHPLANRVGWLGITPLAAAMFAVPLSLITTMLVSLATGGSTASQQAFVDRVRSPDVEQMIAESHDDRAKL